MDLGVKERVHIVPMGYERDRIIKPADQLRADRVYLLYDEEGGEKQDFYLEENKSALQEKNIDVKTLPCKLFNFYDSLGAIGRCIDQHQNDEVFINIAAGSKITAIAGFMAGSIAPDHIDVTTYYGRAKNYEDEPTDLRSGVQKLPDYPIDIPSRQEIVVISALLTLKEAGKHPTKGELIHIAQQNSLEITEGDASEKALYRRLDNEILSPLRERGYVEVDREGRTKIVKITPTGEEAYKAFRPIMTDEGDIDFGTVLEE